MTTKQRTAKGTGTRQIEKLYFDLVDALYEREDHTAARRVANRLEVTASKHKKLPGSIFLDEIRSLIAESRGDLPEAIRCREREIRKILELHNLACDDAAREYVL